MKEGYLGRKHQCKFSSPLDYVYNGGAYEIVWYGFTEAVTIWAGKRSMVVEPGC